MTESIYRIPWYYCHRGWDQKGEWYCVAESIEGAKEQFMKTERYNSSFAPLQEGKVQGRSWEFEDYHHVFRFEVQPLEEIVISLPGLSHLGKLQVKMGNSKEGLEVKLYLEEKI